MGRMHNPPHPGESIREEILPALGITVTEAASQLGVARVTNAEDRGREKSLIDASDPVI